MTKFQWRDKKNGGSSCYVSGQVEIEVRPVKIEGEIVAYYVRPRLGAFGTLDIRYGVSPRDEFNREKFCPLPYWTLEEAKMVGTALVEEGSDKFFYYEPRLIERGFYGNLEGK